MRELFTLLIIASSVISLVACAQQSQLTSDNNNTLDDSISIEKKELKKKGVNEKWETGDSLLKFRFECHANGGGLKGSEVIQVSRSKFHDYFYLRPMSSPTAESTNYAIGSCQMLLDDLARLVKEYKLDDFCYEDIDNFDMNREGWAVTFTTKSGKEYSVVQYGSNEKLQQRIDHLVKKLTTFLTENEITGPFSVYKYKSNGDLSERIDHEADGTVSGGYDPDNPMNDY